MNSSEGAVNLEIDAKFKNLRVHVVRDKTLWASSSYTFYRSDDRGETWKTIGQVPVRFFRSVIGRSGLLRRLLRAEIRNLLWLPSGTLLVIADGKIYRLTANGKNFEEVHRIRRGRGPLAHGCCMDRNGHIYYGEYWLNPSREPVHIYKGIDDGLSWHPVYTFPDGAIRHIHAVQYDPFSGWLWVATGDKNGECQIAYSKDGCHTLTKIGAGSQQWRTVSLMFTKQCVYWGTDAPDKQNYIYRWKRPDGPVEQLVAVDGPVYYSMVLNNQILLATTGVERERNRWDPLWLLSKVLMRSDVERGLGEWDSYAHMWVSVDGKKWIDLAKWKKDWLSPYFFGHGRICFAAEQDDKDHFCFTPIALRGVNNTTFRARVKLGKE